LATLFLNEWHLNIADYHHTRGQQQHKMLCLCRISILGSWFGIVVTGNLRQTQLVFGIGDLAGLPPHYSTRPLSLTNPLWVGAISTDDGFSH